ncbi:TMEM67 [Branchiostoma lanceolatum]|uniref:TMEM67 protein n=1 Tax=Branchiostoma lanceolatum TaxID=7740 RepID=A0A8K0A5D6_BRALA|nr:TMEM67 [Branchiostoma lanceolatum]
MAKMAPRTKILSLLLLLNFYVAAAQFSINYVTTDSCQNPTEYYNFANLGCDTCTGADSQTSSDGFSCACQAGFELTADIGSSQVTCAACAAPTPVTSADGWACVSCGTGTALDPLTGRCNPCPAGQIAVERTTNGTQTSQRDCVACEGDTVPNAAGDRCVRCHQSFIDISGGSCNCPDPNQVHGGICFTPAQIGLSQNLDFTWDSDNKLSYYIEEYLLAASLGCTPDTGATDTQRNLTACQLLGNLCVLRLYNRQNDGTNQEDGCTLLQALSDANNDNVGTVQDWKVAMPWLYYDHVLNDVSEILSDTEISTKFTFSAASQSSKLDLVVAAYSLNGEFLGIQEVTGGLLQLCKDSNTRLDAAYVFGTTYSQRCQLNVQDFWNNTAYQQMAFYDLFYRNPDDSALRTLYAIPVLITNVQYSNTDNSAGDRTRWQLVRRFFLVDPIGTKLAADGEPQVVRYASSFSIGVQLRSGNREGEIYPPLVRITYSEATLDDYTANAKVTVSFSVNYEMSTATYEQDVQIAIGVLSALAILWALFISTSSWRRRIGAQMVDCTSLLKFILYTFGPLGNAFFLVAMGAALSWLLFFKRQDQVYLLLPTPAQEETFIIYLSVACALKCLEMLHFLFTQMTVDIFFIDWERPRGKTADVEGGNGKSQSVSMWRTYFVANEWNEIQTTRKSNTVFQLFTVLLFMNVIGFENLTTTDPRAYLVIDSEQYVGGYSKLLRFGMMSTFYLVVAIAQWLFFTFFYERFVEDKLGQFVDLCSMANVSVFIMANTHFGYYIHGRSVHGQADTGMQEMYEMMVREEDNRCGQRGLLPNTDNQTFEMSLPHKLRDQYDSIIKPLQQQAAAARGQNRPRAGGGNTTSAGVDINQQVDAYKKLNKYLAAFIDHSRPDIDYIVKDKMFLERLLDMEFLETTDKGHFYNDDGHSFDAVLFYGNELVLLTFELVVFSVVDLIGQSYVLDAVITYLISRFISNLRDSGGRKNLAKKTLVDERFLI